MIQDTTLNNQLQTLLNDIVNNSIGDELVKKALLSAHPVGSYYWSSESTDPSTLFGGTWTPIEDRFVYAVKTSAKAGDTGGAATVALTAAQLAAHTHTGPSHTHTVKAHAHGLAAHTHSTPNHVHHIGPHSHSIGDHTHQEMGFSQCGIEASGFGLWNHSDNPDDYRWSKGFDNRVLVENRQMSAKVFANGYSGATTTLNTGVSSGTTGLSGEGDLAAGGGGTSGGPSVANTNDSAAFETAGSGTGATGSTGSGTAHENMPPYITAYCWRRTE